MYRMLAPTLCSTLLACLYGCGDKTVNSQRRTPEPKPEVTRTIEFKSRRLPEGYGSITHDGVEMPIKGVVVYQPPLKPDELVFELIPYEPGADEISSYLSGERLSLIDRERSSPDPDKWSNWIPYGIITLSWKAESDGAGSESVGDFSESFVHIYTNGIREKGDQVNVYSRRGQYQGSLNGTLSIGEPIELILYGQDPLMGDSFQWNLHVSGIVSKKTL